MNLLTDQWLPIIRKDGCREKVAITQLLDQYTQNPVMELEAPRPDFRNAIYQLLIGIVQVALYPDDEEEWGELYHSPCPAALFTEKLNAFKESFEIDSSGPAFMQDFSLTEGEEKPIAALLVEAPGGKTIKDNLDHFIKRDTVNKMDAYWAAVALYTLQTFAPSGGVGHRVGLRGGGPMTTMVLPRVTSTLWQKIWCNVTSAKYFNLIPGNPDLHGPGDIFPWMKPTKQSDAKGSELYALEVHPFHHFFGMPRRIRLCFSGKEGVCDITGVSSTNFVKSFIMKNYGNDYSGPWTHPLNAYGRDPKKPDEPPNSIKPKPEGIGYRYWLGLVVESERMIPATIARLFSESNYRKSLVKNHGTILWAAGYSMDNMKARCWFESTMPVYPLDPQAAHEVAKVVTVMIENARELASSLKSAVKAAWSDRPGDLKGEVSFLDTAFWENTETEFYRILGQLADSVDDREYRATIADEWGRALKTVAEKLFDDHALAQQEDGLDMKRVVKAREGLGKAIGKMINKLKTLKQTEE